MIAINFLSIITGNVLNKAVSLLIVFFLTGCLGPAEYGRYSFVVAYVVFFGTFTDMGINTLATRTVSGKTEDPGEAYGSAIILRLILTLIVYALSLMLLKASGYPSESVGLASVAGLSLFFSFRGAFFRTVFEIPFQARLRMGYPVVTNFLNEILVLGAVVYSVRRGCGLFEILVAINVANIPGFAALLYLSANHLRPVFRFDPTKWMRTIKESFPLGTSAILEGVFVLAPVAALSWLSTEEDLAFFSLPFRVVSSLWIAPVALMMSFFPAMSRNALSRGGFPGVGFRGCVTAMAALGLIAASTISYFSGPLIQAISGVRYSEAVPSLSIMSWGTLFYFVNTVFYYSFTAGGRQGVNARAWAVVTISSIVLNLALVPYGGHVGAAVSYVASLGAGFLVYVWYFYGVRGREPFEPLFARSSYPSPLQVWLRGRGLKSD